MREGTPCHETMTGDGAVHVQGETTSGLLEGGCSKQEGQAEMEEEQCWQHWSFGPSRAEEPH